MTKTVTFRYLPPREDGKEAQLTFEVTDEPSLSARLVSGHVELQDLNEATYHAFGMFLEPK